jgi:hypothetical protein
MVSVEIASSKVFLFIADHAVLIQEILHKYTVENTANPTSSQINTATPPTRAKAAAATGTPVAFPPLLLLELVVVTAALVLFSPDLVPAVVLVPDVLAPAVAVAAVALPKSSAPFQHPSSNPPVTTPGPCTPGAV